MGAVYSLAVLRLLGQGRGRELVSPHPDWSPDLVVADSGDRRNMRNHRRQFDPGGGLRQIVREDLAVLYIGQRFGDLVGVDRGHERRQRA
jgi:hypothetical protein